MARRGHENDLVAEERLEDDATVPARRTHDAELELALGNAVDHGLGVRDGERDVQVRVPALELAEEKRHEVGSRSRRGPDGERPAQSRAVLGDLLEELLLEREHAVGAAVEALAGLGRLDASPRAVEECLPEPLLEGTHLEAHRRLGDAELLGRL